MRRPMTLRVLRAERQPLRGRGIGRRDVLGNELVGVVGPLEAPYNHETGRDELGDFVAAERGLWSEVDPET